MTQHFTDLFVVLVLALIARALLCMLRCDSSSLDCLTSGTVTVISNVHGECCRFITSAVTPSNGPHSEAQSEAAYSADSEAQAGMSAAAILDGVLAAVQSVLGREAAAQDSLMEVGLDSLGAVELRNALSQSFEVELPATFTFDYPTAQAMAGCIASLKGATADGGTGQVHSMHKHPQAGQRLSTLPAGQSRRDAGMQAITGISVR